jgi:hypothetical protein
LGGPQSWSGRRGEEKILDPTGTRTPTPRPSSKYLVAILTTLLHRAATPVKKSQWRYQEKQSEDSGKIFSKNLLIINRENKWWPHVTKLAEFGNRSSLTSNPKVKQNRHTGKYTLTDKFLKPFFSALFISHQIFCLFHSLPMFPTVFAMSI